MRLYRKDLFPNLSQYNFLKKIQQFHDETNLPIYISIKRLPVVPPSTIISEFQQKMEPFHIELVKKYLSPKIYRIAQDTYKRSQYHQIKLKITFLENAIQQIQEYDVFYLNMDDIHEIDMVITCLSYQQMDYR